MIKWLFLSFVLFFSYELNSKQLANFVFYDENLAPEEPCFKKGELLIYNIHYGIVSAGEATFFVADSLKTIANKPHYHFKVTGKSYKVWDYFFKVRDVYQSFVDVQTLLPTIYQRTIQEGEYFDDESFLFLRNQELAKGTSKGESLAVKIPNDVHDLVSMIYYARSINFRNRKIGEELPLTVFFAGEWFKSGAKYLGKEEVKTALGTFRCIKVAPQLIEGRVFKGQNDMIVYVSDDANQVPIRIESEIFIGSIKVDLIAFEKLKYPLDSQIK